MSQLPDDDAIRKIVRVHNQYVVHNQLIGRGGFLCFADDGALFELWDTVRRDNLWPKTNHRPFPVGSWVLPVLLEKTTARDVKAWLEGSKSPHETKHANWSKRA